MSKFIGKVIIRRPLWFVLGLAGMALPISWVWAGDAGVAALAIPTSLVSLKQDSYLHFNRTPDQVLRPMTVDGAQTLDVGRVQVEMDLASTTLTRSSDGVATATSVAPMTIRVGGLRDLDMQLHWSPYNVERDGAGNVVAEGAEHLEARMKLNVWGNDGGDSALAIMPYLRIPTPTKAMGNQAMELGMTVPYDQALPHDWSLSLSGDVALLKEEEGVGYRPALNATATLGRPIKGDLSGYVELSGDIDGADWSAPSLGAAAGVSYALRENFAIDAGVCAPLTDPGAELGVAVSAAARF